MEISLERFKACRYLLRYSHFSTVIARLPTKDTPDYLDEYLEEMMKTTSRVTAVQNITEVILYELARKNVRNKLVRSCWISALREFCRKYSVPFILDINKKTSGVGVETSRTMSQGDNKNEDMSYMGSPANDFYSAI